MAWNCHFRWSIMLAVILSVTRLASQFYWDFPWSTEVAILNAILPCGVLLLLATLTARLSRATHVLRERVRTLEGILPICAFCKDIRDEAGDWQKMESYVSKRSEAQFSHGVCPSCAEKHYGKVLTDPKPTPPA
ncbi:MAG: hypothetical protein ACR2G0_07290 [Chthoniobacterales bacterium]